MFLALLSFAGFTWRQVDTMGTKAFVKLQRIKCIKNTLINVFFGFFFLHSCVDSLQLHKGFDPHCVNLTPRKASKA